MLLKGIVIIISFVFLDTVYKAAALEDDMRQKRANEKHNDIFAQFKTIGGAILDGLESNIARQARFASERHARGEKDHIKDDELLNHLAIYDIHKHVIENLGSTKSEEFLPTLETESLHKIENTLPEIITYYVEAQNDLG